MGIRDWLSFGKGKDEKPKDYDNKAGIGKVGGSEQVSPPKPKKPRGSDAETAQIVNEAQLREMGVSDEMLQILRKHGHTIRAKALTEEMASLNKDLEYEGLPPIRSAEHMLKVIIAHSLLEKTRSTQVEQIEKSLRTMPPNSPDREVTIKLEMKLRAPLTFQQVTLMLEAEQLLKAEGGSETITDADLDQAVTQLKKRAYVRKANRLAHSEAQFLLKKALNPDFKPRDEFEETALSLRKQFGEEVPQEQVTELARRIFVHYKAKNPFKA